MRSSSAKNLQRIRRALGSPSTASLPLQVRLLAHAAANSRPERSACARCHLEMPAYVDAELEHRLPALSESFSRQHLLTCQRCSKDYADLLETAILFAESRLPHPSRLSKPDLWFLRGSNG